MVSLGMSELRNRWRRVCVALREFTRVGARALVLIAARSRTPFAARPTGHCRMGNIAVRRNESDEKELMLDRVARLDPRVDPAIQWTDPLEPDLPERLRNLDRSGLVWARTVDDDLAVG